jgi:hypothetical protein
VGHKKGSSLNVLEKNVGAIGSRCTFYSVLYDSTGGLQSPRQKQGQLNNGPHWLCQSAIPWGQIHEPTISLRFLGIILRVLRLEVSEKCLHYKPVWGGGGFCPNYVQELGLCCLVIWLYKRKHRKTGVSWSLLTYSVMVHVRTVRYTQYRFITTIFRCYIIITSPL